MAGPRLTPGGALLLISLVGAAGCSAAPPPKPVQSRAKEKKEPAVQPAETTPPPSPAPPASPDASKDASTDASKNDKGSSDSTAAAGSGSGSKVDVVDPGGESGPVDIVQAAKAERERRAHAGAPLVVINDKTLPHLPKGQVTYADPAKKKGAPAAKPGSDEGSTAQREQYWRERAVDIRTRWKNAADEVKELEQSAAGWRRRFYAENDPYTRDSQVKPEWDRVLERLSKARAAVDAAKKELADFMEEGRQAGALPGWLREGAELEPPPADAKKPKGPGNQEPKEPSIYQENQEAPPP